MAIVEFTEWDRFLKAHPEAHLLQTPAWGELKSKFGWEAVHVVGKVSSSSSKISVGAQILFRKLGFGYNLAYIPKGPVWEGFQNKSWDILEDFWLEVDRICRGKRAIFLIEEPDLYADSQSAGRKFQQIDQTVPTGFRPGNLNIQPQQTIIMDVRGSEQEILARMKQKTRYNIRLAARKGVTASSSKDISSFYKLMTVTGSRDNFGVHSQQYYQTAYDCFQREGSCELLLANYKGEPVAGIMVFSAGTRAWYLYGASSNQHRHRMPNYLLQWEAVKWVREKGCESYDLWGVPDEPENALEAGFTGRSDGLWGVYRFKRGFGGEVTRSMGPWERVFSPGLYSIFNLVERIRRVSSQDN